MDTTKVIVFAAIIVGVSALLAFLESKYPAFKRPGRERSFKKGFLYNLALFGGTFVVVLALSALF